MGLFLRRHAEDAAATASAPEKPQPAHALTFNTLIAHLLSQGTFSGSLDNDPDFAIELTDDGLQIAQNDAEAALCIIADRVVGFSIVGMDPSDMVLQIVDPVMNQIFHAQPAWQSDDAHPVLWMARHYLGNGLALWLDCKIGPAELACKAGPRNGAISTLQIVTEH